MLPVVGWDGYFVTDDGRVWSTKSNRFLKPELDRYGYVKITLSGIPKSRTTTVHRLVAEAFIPNPENLATVNHINEDKTDNRVENLEWMSVKNNNNYGTRNIRMSISKCHNPVIQINPDGTEVWHRGVKEAWRATGVRWSQIARACQGIIPHTRNGLRWRYENENYQVVRRESNSGRTT